MTLGKGIVMSQGKVIVMVEVRRYDISYATKMSVTVSSFVGMVVSMMRNCKNWHITAAGLTMSYAVVWILA